MKLDKATLNLDGQPGRSWLAAAMHGIALAESALPSTHDRAYKGLANESRGGRGGYAPLTP